MTNIRLNKYLSESGVCSRRKADELIAGGVVCIDGRTAKIGNSINPKINFVTVDGKEVKRKTSNQYFAFYKPKGIISSLSDEQGEGISKFLPKDSRLFPVGRLDKDSEGLLILTDDGDFANELNHPSNIKEKVYQLEFVSKPTRVGKEGIIRTFKFGVKFHGENYKVDRVKFVAKNKLEVIIHEGKNRQLRVIAGKIGLEISKLVRSKVGKLYLSKLKLHPGELKKISKNDVL